jgi:transcriptional repressor NrdR
MQCTSCDYPDTCVVKTTQDDKLNQIYRRRECIRCGTRFTTQEHSRENYKRSDYKTPQPKKILDK